MDITSLVGIKQNPNIPELRPGDTVKVNAKVVEGEKERIQVFKGVVVKVRQGADGGNFTVRRVTYGVGVERTFPLQSPFVEKVEVLRHGKVRRARLYYLRGLSGKRARIKEKRLEKGLEEILGQPPEPEAMAEQVLAQAEVPIPETPQQAPEETKEQK